MWDLQSPSRKAERRQFDLERPAACERKGAVFSCDLTRLPNETDDAQMDQIGDQRLNQERASGHLIWNDRKRNKTKQRTHVHLRTTSPDGLPLWGPDCLFWSRRPSAQLGQDPPPLQEELGLWKGVWTSSCFHSRLSFSFLQCLPIMHAGGVSSVWNCLVPGLSAAIVAK